MNHRFKFLLIAFIFFFSSRRRHTRCSRDWSSDVCSSDLALLQRIGRGIALIPASHERDLEKEYIQDNDFRQNNTFFYFTELETQDAWLLLTARGPDSLETVLFLPPRNPGQERNLRQLADSLRE